MPRSDTHRKLAGIAASCVGLAVFSGCYTELTHPDYDTEHVEYTDSDADCTRCHVHGHSWSSNSYYRWGYGWMASPWLYDPVYRYYYGDPWWWEPPPPSDPGLGSDLPSKGSLGDRGAPGRRQNPPGDDASMTRNDAPVPITGPIEATSDKNINDNGQNPQSPKRRDKSKKNDLDRKNQHKMKSVGRPEKSSNNGSDRSAPARRKGPKDDADRD